MGKRVVGLFAGIGGIEAGLARSGFEAELLCEIDPGARAVLAAEFPDAELVEDVEALTELPACNVLTAGFPCQDLSQAGRTAGIGGSRSGLVQKIFELLDASSADPEWLLLENVPFMLRLDKGKAMNVLTELLESRGYRWAYRLVDARAFGLPQRRRRVVVLASKTADPLPVLFGQDTDWVEPTFTDQACGFYWTEGNTGLGFVVDAIPTLKAGSSVGVPSPPAIWHPNTGSIVTPSITDAERLQGFEPDRTVAALEAGVRKGFRWKYAGNAVPVPLAGWVGERLVSDCGVHSADLDSDLNDRKWPDAAWGEKGRRHSVDVSRWPVQLELPSLANFITDPQPLSERALRGFHKRLNASSLRRAPAFDNALDLALAAF